MCNLKQQVHVGESFVELGNHHFPLSVKQATNEQSTVQNLPHVGEGAKKKPDSNGIRLVQGGRLTPAVASARGAVTLNTNSDHISENVASSVKSDQVPIGCPTTGGTSPECPGPL